MFESITDSLGKIFRKLGGKGVLTEKNIREGLREVRVALLEADVNYRVVKRFVNQVTERAVGHEVIKQVRPAEQVVKIVHEVLVELMGPTDPTIPRNPKGPTVVMMAGLHGCGKTTTCAKYALHARKKDGRRPLLVAADVQRPAAIEQLQVLGSRLELPVYAEPKGRPPRICQRAVDHAVKEACDLVILDTAGRLHIDAQLMAELREVEAKVHPDQIYLVADAMTGQDAVNSAREFNEQLELNGVILTKLDGDARGGAALSIKAVTGKPINFVGVGEKLEDFEAFHPDRMASRILGMGDVVTLVEKAQEQMDVDQALKMQEKVRKLQFNLQDFLDQLQQVKKMGPLQDLLKMIPGFGSLSEQVDASQMKQIEAIIYSMTPKERHYPEIIDGSRRRRIANGSGTTVQEVNALLRQFKDMKRMMKGMRKFMKKKPKGGEPPDMAKLFGRKFPR